MDTGLEHELRDLAHRAGLCASDADALTGFLGLLADQPEAATDDDLTAAVVTHQHVTAVLLGAAAGWQARWDTSLVWALDGARSAPTWLQTHCPVSRTRGAGQLRMAAGLADTPIVAAAARAGELGEEAVRLLLAARTDATTDAFTRDEAHLVNTCKTLTVEGARRYLEHWRNLNDTDGPAPNDQTTSHLHLSPTLGGKVRADGTLNTEHGATILNAINNRIDAWHRAGLLADDPRTRSELIAAALAEICAADNTLPATRRATLLITVSETTLAGTHWHDPDNGPGGTGGPDGIGRPDGVGPCDIAAVGPIHPHTARRLACTGDLHRVIMSADGEVLDVGMAKRLATNAQWRALTARSHGHCEYPGCDVPHTWCQAHHLDPYTPNPDHPDGGTGPTDLANLAVVCSFHHHLIHEGGHTLARGPTGNLTAHDPHGRPTNPTRTQDPQPRP